MRATGQCPWLVTCCAACWACLLICSQADRTVQGMLGNKSRTNDQNRKSEVENLTTWTEPAYLGSKRAGEVSSADLPAHEVGLQVIKKAPSLSSPTSERFLPRMPLSLSDSPRRLIGAAVQLLEEKRGGQKWEKPVNILTMIFISFLFFPPPHCLTFYHFLCSFL